MEEKFEFSGPAGLLLRARAWTDSSNARTVVGIHGYSEHSRCYEHFARFLNAGGYNVFFLDLPGHGESSGRRYDIARFDLYLLSFSAFLANLDKKFGVNEFSLFGHSLGGLIAICFTEQHPEINFKSLTLSSPLLGLSQNTFHALGRFLQSDRALTILEKILGVLPNLSLPNQHDLGGSILTRDPEMQRKRKEDPLIRPAVTLRWTREFLKARRKAFEGVYKLNRPVGVFQAGKDFVVSQSQVERFFNLVPAPQKTMKIYQDSYHEILNDLNRDEVMADILHWLDHSFSFSS
jgi:lysophospholipase